MIGIVLSSCQWRIGAFAAPIRHASQPIKRTQADVEHQARWFFCIAQITHNFAHQTFAKPHV
jgi:hypothetical protein